jgi:AraC-like DNA-binding protein
MFMNLFLYSSSGLNVSHSLDDSPEPREFRLHTHGWTEIYCFLGGKAVFHIEGTQYPLEVGDLLVMRPGESHYIETDPAVPYERIVVNFDNSLFCALDPEKRLIRPLLQRTAGTLNQYKRTDFPQGSHLAHLKAMLHPDKDRIEILTNLIRLLQMVGVIFQEHCAKYVPEVTLEQQIIQYINRHPEREITLQSLCDRFYISRAQLCRRFRKATGISVGKYIGIKRLTACRQLILDGEKPTKVCTTFGFRDYSSFYRAYCAQFGHSPRQESAELP